MKRNEFLKGIGLLGAGSIIPFKAALADEPATAAKTTACSGLIPTETDGPFPLDLTENNYYFRQDIREDRTGALHTVKLRILNSNCDPIKNARVNIWHCDKDGIYSGYAGGMNQGGSASTKWLRGYQMTDANGDVAFTTVFPGWYSGRLCHIHFQVYVSSVYKVISQLTFPIATKDQLYADNSTLYTKGADGTKSLAADNIFNNDNADQKQIATLTGSKTAGYESFLQVTVNTTNTLGLDTYEGETGGVFKMGQNFPNPHRGSTTIPFSLAKAAAVQIDLYDLNARKVGTLDLGNLSIGDHTALVDLSSMRLPVGNYLYQLQATTADGPFRQVKMMTAY